MKKLLILLALILASCGPDETINNHFDDGTGDADSDADTDTDSDADTDTGPQCVHDSDCERLKPNRSSYNCFGGFCFYGPLIDANLVIRIETPGALMYDEIQFSVELVEDLSDIGDSWLENVSRVNWSSVMEFRAEQNDLKAVRFNAAYCNAGTCANWLCEGYMGDAHLTANVTVRYNGRTYPVKTLSKSWVDAAGHWQYGCSALSEF